MKMKKTLAQGRTMGPAVQRNQLVAKPKEVRATGISANVSKFVSRAPKGPEVTVQYSEANPMTRTDWKPQLGEVQISKPVPVEKEKS